jgi:DNA-binding MarR family transcriptional regulator
MVRPPLALVLLRASRWFDSQLLEQLVRRGWPRLTPAQSLVFAHLSEDGTSPSELARRQAAHELVAGLQGLALLEVVEDPARRRGRLVTLTPDGHRLAGDARQVLAELEEELGRERVDALHGLLEGLDRAVEASASAGAPS